MAEGGRDRKSLKYKDNITPAKMEGVKGQLIGKDVIGTTKTEGPIDVPPTYAELASA